MEASRMTGTAGIETLPSRYGFTDTVERLLTAIVDKGLTLFTVIDHARAAHEAGMAMPPTRVLVFGAPKTGTLLMMAYPDLALDLPLRVLVREDVQGRAWVSFHAVADIAWRHGLPADTAAPLASAAGLIRAAVEADEGLR